MILNSEERRLCPMRHKNGNCLPMGGFCINGVDDEICHALNNAYDMGLLDGTTLGKIKTTSEKDVAKSVQKLIRMYADAASNAINTENSENNQEQRQE